MPVLVGTAAAAGAVPAEASGSEWWSTADPDGPLRGIELWRALMVLVVTLGIQVGTNFANDYSDGKRGTDNADRVGPVRLVGSGLASPESVKRAAVLSFAVAAVAGLVLAAAVTWWLIPVGAVCFAAGWLYTGGPRPYGYSGFGEIFVFVFFGLVATTGSAFVQMEGFTLLSVAVGVPVGLLATALLVVNNLRDIPTDAAAGKRTLAVKMGDRNTRLLYVGLIVATFLTVPVIAGGSQRIFAAAALFTVVLARIPVQRVLEGATGAGLIKVLASTGRLQAAFGLIFAAGLFYGVP